MKSKGAEGLPADPQESLAANEEFAGTVNGDHDPSDSAAVRLGSVRCMAYPREGYLPARTSARADPRR